MMNVLPVLGNLHRPADTVCDITVAGEIVTVLLEKWRWWYFYNCSII
jgi:hypothetical protein